MLMFAQYRNNCIFINILPRNVLSGTGSLQTESEQFAEQTPLMLSRHHDGGSQLTPSG